MPPVAYYLSLFTSEYQSSPNFLAFAAALLQPLIDIGNCAASMNDAFALSTPPVGNQLNVLGQILGISRTLPFTPTGGYSPILDDVDYLVLLQAKVLFNQFNGFYQGEYSTLWQDWQTIFPGGRIYITDNQNMSATIYVIGSFTPLQKQMIQNGLIVPRPQGVQFTYEFGTLPLFGFDNLNPSFVAGWDTGHWG